MKSISLDSQQKNSQIHNYGYKINNDEPRNASEKKYHRNYKFGKSTDNFINEALKNCFQPENEQKKIEYELELSKKVERQRLENVKLNGPLSIYHLFDLTEKEFDFEKINAGNKKEFINEIFFVLKRNTEKFEGKWSFVKNVVGKDIKKAFDKNPVVAGRFGDIPLVVSTAIPDQTRPNVFIHANRVDLGADRKFIASQRPTSSEIPGFWNAVSTHSVSMIIDLTNKNDATKDKRDWKTYCPTLPFWKMDFKGFYVNEKIFQGIKNTSRFFKENIRQKCLVIQSQTSSHSLVRIKFHQWPDQGVVNPEILIELTDLAESLGKNKTGPILIHCRAGVGRTGTLMSFMAAREILSRKYAATDTLPDMQTILCTVLEVVAKGRLDRGPSFVQTRDQFELIIDALILHFDNVKSRLTQSPHLGDVRSWSDGAMNARQGGLRRQELILGQASIPRPGKAMSTILEEDEEESNPAAVLLTGGVSQVAPETVTGLEAPLSGNEKRSRAQPDTQFGQDTPSMASWLWRTLKVNSRKKGLDFLNADEVDDNGTKVSCPRHSAVEVDLPGNSKKIHANHVHFQPSRCDVELGLNGNSYIAAQAPGQFDACERLLFRGLASRQGIFQIVSERSQRALVGPVPDRESVTSIRSVIEQLREGLAHNPTLTIGARFEVESLEHLRDGMSSSTYLLRVRDTHAENELIAIPLTQVGLKFEGRVLKVPEIATASEELDDHLAFGRVPNLQAANEPIIISTAGVGRNATLIVYRQIASLIESGEITTEGELHSVLLREITIGRNARGPRFVHSESQLEQLTAALVALLPGPRD